MSRRQAVTPVRNWIKPRFIFYPATHRAPGNMASVSMRREEGVVVSSGDRKRDAWSPWQRQGWPVLASSGQTGNFLSLGVRRQLVTSSERFDRTNWSFLSDVKKFRPGRIQDHTVGDLPRLSVYFRSYTCDLVQRTFDLRYILVGTLWHLRRKRLIGVRTPCIWRLVCQSVRWCWILRSLIFLSSKCVQTIIYLWKSSRNIKQYIRVYLEDIAHSTPLNCNRMIK